MGLGFLTGSTITGTLTVSGIATFEDEVLIASGEYLSWGASGSAAIEGSTVSDRLRFYTDSTLAFTLDSSQDATFAGNITGVTQTLTGTESLMLVLNPTANSYGGIWFKYGGVSKGMSVYNSGSMIYGGESGVGTKLQADGQTGLTIDTSQNSTFAGTLTGTFADFYAAGSGNDPILHVKDTADTMVALFEGNRAGDTGANIHIRHWPTTAAESNRTQLFFEMKDDGDNVTKYGTIGCFIDDYTGGTEDGNLRFSVMKAGTSTETMRIDSNGTDFTGRISISGDGSNAATLTESSAGILTIATVDALFLDSADDITLDAAGNDIRLFKAGVEYGKFKNDSGSLALYSSITNEDIFFRGDDGGVLIDALTLDMSEAGTATFNNVVYASNGSKAAPTYSFTGDTNTGMYRGSADSIAFTSGDNTSFVIGASSVTVNENLILTSNANIVLDTNLSGSSGTIIKIGTGTLTAGVCYMMQADKSWFATDIGDEEYSRGLIAIALGSGASAATDDGMLINGIFYDASHSFTIGLPLFLTGDAGALSNTAPSSSGDLVRVVGYAVNDDEIYFCPDNTWVILD